jgi:hypothetical protein
LASTIAEQGSATTLINWTTVYTNINSESFTTDWQLPISVWSSLQSWTTNYIFIRVLDNSVPANSSTTLNYAFYVLKDTVPPRIVDNETTDRGWFKQNPGAIWQVYFEEQIPQHCSKLDTAQWTAYTGPNQTGQQVVSWIDIFNNLGTTSYVQNIDLGTNFELLSAGTNYITIRCIDFAGNTTTWVDSFVVKKDTFGPTIINNVSADVVWFNSDPGAIWDVDFKDELSKLSSAYSIIYSEPNLAGTKLTDWTSNFCWY